MPLLPLDIQDLFLRDISPLDRVQYSKTNRDAYRAVQSFNMRAFRVEKVLLPYFDMVEINEFRRLQKLTGMLVSGSTALQFFDRTTYPESDLDVYVEFEGCMVIVDFLQRVGYRYEMYKEELPTLAAALERVEAVAGIGVELPNVDETWEGYLSNGILGVINFARGGKTVQVIVCRECPMSVILGFHSTCVMNIISHSHAYSLFPRATLVDRVSLMINRFATVDGRQDAARYKYSQRGWTMIETPPTTTALRPQSEFRFTSRCVGDSSCWTIPLSPIQAEDDLDLDLKISSVDPVQGNSWVIAYGHNDETSLSFSVASTSDLKYQYCRSSLLPFPKAGEAGSKDMDEQIPGITRKLVDENLDLNEERAMALLEQVYSSLPPLTDRVDRETPIIPPTPRTAQRLAKVLGNLFQCFRGDPVVEFKFAVGISTPHVWTNVTVSPPHDMRTQYCSPITFSTDEYVTRGLKAYKIGFKLENLKGDVKPDDVKSSLFVSKRRKIRFHKEVQTDSWDGNEHVDVASQAGPMHA